MFLYLVLEASLCCVVVGFHNCVLMGFLSHSHILRISLCRGFLFGSWFLLVASLSFLLLSTRHHLILNPIYCRYCFCIFSFRWILGYSYLLGRYRSCVWWWNLVSYQNEVPSVLRFLFPSCRMCCDVCCILLELLSVRTLILPGYSVCLFC